MTNNTNNTNNTNTTNNITYYNHIIINSNTNIINY